MNEVIEEIKTSEIPISSNSTTNINNSQSQKKIKILVILLSIFFLFLLIFIPLILLRNKKTNSNNNQQSFSTAAPILIPVYIGNYDVYAKVNVDSPCNSDKNLIHCKSDIYLKDKTTGKETYALTTNDVVNDSRVPQYRYGYIFLVKRIVNSEYTSEDWTDEVWVYVDNNKGTKIYDSKGVTFNFNANKDGSLVVILLEDSVILLSKDNDWQPKTYTVSNCTPSEGRGDSDFQLGFERWEQNSPAIWGIWSTPGRGIGCYWKLNPETLAVAYYPVFDIQQLFAWNPDRVVALYIDKPQFFTTADSANQWISTHSTYSLYLYHLQTRNIEKIASFPSSFEFDVMSVDWDSLTQFHYPSPKGKSVCILNNGNSLGSCSP